jgi:hypothetical protein
MKNLLQKILSLFNSPSKDEEIILKFAEKKEKGLEISEQEKEEVLKAAIRITKNQNPS